MYLDDHRLVAYHAHIPSFFFIIQMCHNMIEGFLELFKLVKHRIITTLRIYSYLHK